MAGSGSAPTPGLFGRDEAEEARNPRSAAQMATGTPRSTGVGSWWTRPAEAAQNPSQQRVGTFAQGWWNSPPERTTLATTTGQNLSGPTNAFSNEWWDAARVQDEEWREKGEQRGRWDRSDAAGIATYSFGQDGEVPSGMEGEKVRFGDVFSGGKVVGNVYEGYGGMTTKDADEIMARLVLPREVWAAAYETEAGQPLTFTGNLRQEIERAAAEQTENFSKGLTAGAFEAGVAERAAGMEEAANWQWGNVAAGAGGGAAVATTAAAAFTAVTGGAGAVAAPFIIIGGAILGGLGAYLNRDEQFRLYAQALEQQELAFADGHTAVGYADAAAGFAGAAMSSMNVSRNLLHGAYDHFNSEGGIGDQSSAYQDAEVPLWMQGADFGALLLDGIGMFGTGIARKVYTYTMGATALSGGASVTAGAMDGGLAFNPYSGTYEQLSAWGQVQRAGSVGIDVAQTAAVGMLSRYIRGAAGRTGGVASGGHVITTSEAGVRSARLGFSMLIPSEAAVGVSARMFARRAVNKMGPMTEGARRDALRVQTARQLENLTTGRNVLATATVNGFGEGAEEFVQAVLEATAFGETPTLQELINASKQGFAMGAGMGRALGIGSKSRSSAFMDRANAVREFRGQDLWTNEEWAKLTDSERAAAGTLTLDEAESQFEAAAEEMIRMAGPVAAANFVELRRISEVAKQTAEQSATHSQRVAEPTRLSLMSNFDWAPQDYVVSLTAAIRDSGARIELITEALGRQDTRAKTGATLLTLEQKEMLARILDSDTALLARMQDLKNETDALIATGTPEGIDQVRAMLQNFNRQLQDWWNATDTREDGTADDTAFGRRRSVSVWGARYPLNSAGSFQLLRLQISPDMTLTNKNNAALVPDDIQDAIAGDYDGDRFGNMLRQLLPEETYQELKHGSGLLTKEGVMLRARPFVKAYLETMFESLQKPGSHAYQVANDALDKIRGRLNSVLEQSSIPEDIRRNKVQFFVNELAANKPESLGTFLDDLAKSHAVQMRELALRIGDNPFRIMARSVETEMRIFQDATALRTDARTVTGQMDLPEASRNMPRRHPNRVRAASAITDAAIQGMKYDISRLLQVLKYNAIREPIQTTPEETADVMYRYYQQFAASNDGIIRAGEKAIFESTIAQDRTISWLEGYAEEYRKAFQGLTKNEAMVLLAGAKIDNVEGYTRSIRGDGEITLIQALLREVVLGLRAEYIDIMDDVAIAQRLNALDALTNPNYNDGQETHAQGGEAFVEVLGAYPVTVLIGQQGAAIGTYTVRGLRDKIRDMRWDARERFIDSLMAHPSYDHQDGVPTSAYRVLVDNVVQSARMQLSEDRDTGEVRGSLTQPSRMASANFVQMHDATQKAADNRNMPRKTAAEVRAFLETDPRLAEAILRVVEARGVRAGTVQYNANGEISAVHFPPWIYDVLAEPSTARAEMMLLRYTLDFAKLGLQTLDDDGQPMDQLDPHRVNDRLLRLELDLEYRASQLTADSVFAATALEDYRRLKNESPSTEAFIGALNRDFRFRDERSAPFIAWSRDRSLVEADRFGRGISDIQEGVEMRDALREAARVAAATLHQVEAVKDYVSDSAELINRLRESMANAKRGRGDTQLWDRFQAWFSMARDLPTMVAASVWIQQAGHINEIVGNMAVKGISAENVEALGKAIAAQLPSFDAAAGRLISSMTSGSLYEVTMDMTSLVRGNRTILLDDGTVVNWESIDAEMAVELLANASTAGMASRMLGLTAWDYSADLDQNILVSAVGRGLVGFTANMEESLWGSDTSSKFRRMMILEAMSTAPGGVPMVPVRLAELMNVREIPSDHIISDQQLEGGTERERMAVQALEDLADAFDKLSRIRTTSPAGVLQQVEDDPEADDGMHGSGDIVTLLNRTLRRAGRKARIAKGTDNIVDKLLPAQPGPVRDAMLQQLTSEADIFAALAVSSGDPLLNIEKERLNAALANSGLYTSPLDVVLNTYRDYTSPSVQSLLRAYAAEYGDLITGASWARDQVLRLMDPRGLRLSDEDWHMVARAVIAHTMHLNYGVAARSDTRISLFPKLNDPDALAAERPYWDPTFVEVGLDIFAPDVMNNPNAKPTPLMTSAIELYRSLGPVLEDVTPEQAEAAVYKLIRPQTRDDDGNLSEGTGQWNSLVPALMRTAAGAAIAASAASGISMAGINPERLRMLIATTRQHWTGEARPDDAELSTATLSAAQLIAAVSQGVELTSQVSMEIAGRTDPATRPLAQLEGRVVRGLTITLPGQEPVAILNHPRWSTGLQLPTHTEVAAGEAGVINLDTLSQAVETMLTESQVLREQWDQTQLTISFFHPETKSVSSRREDSANYDHNPWFDGVGAATDAAFTQRSLLGSFYFMLDGMIPAAYATAMDAVKSLQAALQQVTTMGEPQRQTLIGLGVTNMAQTLHELTSFAVKQKIDGKPIGLRNYNALYKLFSLMYVVRYVDEAGAHVLSAEEVLARQMRGEHFTAESHAEVIGLPLHFVLALMGELDLAAYNMAITPWGERLFSPDISQARQYLRFPTHAWTDRLFGGLLTVETAEDGSFSSWGTANLLAEARLRNQSLPRATSYSRNGISRRARRDYWGGRRKHKQEVHDQRRLGAGVQTEWAQQAQDVRALDRRTDVSLMAFQYAQLVAEGRPADAARLTAPKPIDVAPTNDYRTGWRYLPYGGSRGERGILLSPTDISQQTAIDDFVIIHAEDFYSGAQDPRTVEDLMPMARDVIDALNEVGATIELPVSQIYGNDLRNAMARYARSNDYVEDGFNTGRFVPRPHAEESQTVAAIHSTLERASFETSANHVLVDHSVHNATNDGAAFEVNGGFDVMESIDAKDVVQTARFAGYAPLYLTKDNEREHAITLLLKVLRSTAGRAYLREQSQIDPKDAEAVRELDREMDVLRNHLLAAREDPSIDLVPADGTLDFGTGSLIALGAYNDQQELIGLHLMRHGHVAVDERTLHGAALPKGNAALGVEGVRLTIDKAKVDTLSTTHRGVLVERTWRGQQGFEARIRVDVPSMASKLTVIGAALKMTVTPGPERQLIPRRNVFANQPVLLATDLASADSKTSDEHLNTAGRIIRAAGYDVMPHLVRVIYGIEFDSKNRVAFDEAAGKVLDALETYSREHGHDIDPAAVVTRRTDTFDAQLRAAATKALNDALEDAQVDLSDLSTEQSIADNKILEMVTAALAAGADVSEVISAPGYIGRPAGSPSHTMHPVFTTLMDQLAWDHPARVAFTEQINARMMPAGATEGYELDRSFNTWVRHVVDVEGRFGEAGARYEIPAMLSYKQVRITDTNDALAELAQARRQRGTISPTTQAMVMTAAGATAILDRTLRTGAEVIAPNEFLHGGESGLKSFFYGGQVNESPFIPRMDDDLQLLEQEQRHFNVRALPAATKLKQSIDMSDWYTDLSKSKARYLKGKYLGEFGKTLIALGLNKGDEKYLVEFMRSVTARLAPDHGEPEHMTYTEAMRALALIQQNARSHNLPTHGGAVNIVSRDALYRLKNAGYELWAGDGSKKPVVSRDEWVEVILSDAFTDDPSMRRYPAVTNAIDGLLFEYRKDVKGLPATINKRLAPIFALARTPSGAMISSPFVRNDIVAPIIQDGRVVELDELTSGDWMTEELPQEARSMLEKRMTAWESKKGLRTTRQSPRSEARRGIHIRESLARTNVILRYITLGYVLKTLVNPGLFISAFVELGIKGGQENVVDFLSGQRAGAQGFTPLQRQMWNATVQSYADSPQFFAQVYRNTNYQQLMGADSRIEQWAEHLANRMAGAFNDPTWRTRSPIMARAFLTAAWDSAKKFSGDRDISIEQFLEVAGMGVEELARISPDAVAHGFSRIEYRRNLQDNLVAQMVRTSVDNVINSGRVGNILGTLLLRLPTMFFRFRSNTLINMFGMQAPHAILTQLLSERSKRPGGFRDHITGADEGMDIEVSAQARIEDSYDLTRAIIRSGVSHTHLMILGSVLSALGFGGDDDEKKLLNKLRRYQKAYVAKDPLALENDFRNAEAWFSDLLPAGMGVPSWIIRPFVSPAMGVARFYETGDFRQVFYGVADALGNMPLLNVDTVLNSWKIANEMAAAAEAKSLEENVESTAEAGKLMWTTMGVLEAMLFESAFASMLYQAADEYDRDPYKIPEMSRDGVIQRDRLGLPLPTEALTDYIDDEGVARQGYLNRNDTDAFLHSLGENRPFFAWAASKIMQDSSFIRTNMPPKTRRIDADPLTEEEAAQIVVSVFNNESGSEEVTFDGALGIIRGVHLGTVSLSDPALQGVFIPEDMRAALSERFLEELTVKYTTLGYGKSDALSAAKEEFYGQAYGAPEGLGLADIIWSTDIPRYQTQRYYQLNTTYVMGPGGYPIATGLRRSMLLSVGLNPEGWGPFETFHDGTTGNLDVDQLLNSVDPVRGINLGQRGLMKADESWIPPSDEDLAEMLEDALDRIADRLDDLIDTTGGGFGGFGGGRGSYGGYTSRANYGGQAQRLNTPRGIGTPYALNPRTAFPGNPFIRRATIRRERISSERGRLNQWQ